MTLVSILRYLILFLSICLFFISIIFSNYNVLLFAICSLLIHNLIFSLERFSERIVFFVFNITFFTFLIGRLVVKTITNYEDKYNNNIFGLSFNNDQVIWNIFLVLFISLICLFIGFVIVKKNNNIDYRKFTNVVAGVRVDSIAIVSLTLFYLTYFFNILVLVDQVRFTSQEGYAALYASYTSSYPFVFTKIAEMCPVALFVYLGTLPKKRRVLFPLLLYILLGVISLFVGNRNDFVLNLLVVLVYFCIRNITDKRERWFGRKEIVLALSLVPILIFLLNAVSYIRADEVVKHGSFMHATNEFFYTQGVSVNLIGYAQTLDDQLRDDTLYTFGRITDFLRNNTITQTLFDIPKYESQTLESALYGNSFADSVSYLISPSRYLNGWGYGSSYVAELYKDFGYLGVIIGNIFIGILLACMLKLFRLGVFGAWASLSMIRLLMYAPRDTFASFLVTTFSLINILTLLIIYFGALIIGGKKSKFEKIDKEPSYSKV